MKKFICLYIAVSICLFISAQKPVKRPNIIFVLADDLGWNDVGFTGNDFIETPNLDRMSKRSVRFMRAYASSPVCSPSRATILTGKNPEKTGITDWLPGRAFYLPKEKIGKLLPPTLPEGISKYFTTLPQVLQKYGYKTAHVGKWHLGGGDYAAKNYGFDFSIGGYNAGSPSTYFYPYVGVYGKDSFVMTDLQPGGKPGEYLTDRLTNETINFIADNKESPFFIYLSHYAPHIPIEPKSDLLKKYQEKKIGFKGKSFANAEYAALVDNLDENIGRLEKALDSMHLLENTIIVFTSDNGGVVTPDDKYTPASNHSPYRSGKAFLYEGGIKVPAILYAPGLFKKGFDFNQINTTADWFKTLLGAAGISEKTTSDGINLLPLMKNGKTIERDYVWYYPHYSNQGSKPASAIRSGNWKLILNYEDDFCELYNLNTDLGETKNVAKQNILLVKKLKQKLQTHLKISGAKMPQLNPYHKL